MPEKRVIFILLIFLISIYSCIETDIDYTFPFEEEPVAFGFLDSSQGLRVWVGKSAKIIGTDSSIVHHAQVDLYNRSGFLETLNHLQKNLFQSNALFIPKTNTEYQFKAKSDEYSELMVSDFISLSVAIPILSVIAKKISSGDQGIDLFIELDDPAGFNAYGTHIQRFYKDTALDIDYKTDPFFVPIYSGIINDREFDGSKHSIRKENFQLEARLDNHSFRADSLQVTLFSIDKDLYDLFLSLNTPEPGSGEPFFDPPIIQTNTKKGILVFGSYAQSSFGIKLD